jgi:hypothetical protein
MHAFQIAAGNIVEKQINFLAVMPGFEKTIFNLRLIVSQPSQVFV